MAEKMKHTISFWCNRKHCGGRVFQEEIFWEARSYGEDTKVKKVELKCILCSRIRVCEYKDYRHLLQEIERVITKRKKSEDRAKSLLSTK